MVGRGGGDVGKEVDGVGEGMGEGVDGGEVLVGEKGREVRDVVRKGGVVDVEGVVGGMVMKEVGDKEVGWGEWGKDGCGGGEV